MWTSRQSPWHIIGNPLCGAVNLAAWATAARAELPDGSLVDAHATAHEARAAIGEEKWGKKPILCPVRLPLDRFQSAVASLLRAKPEELTEAGMALAATAEQNEAGYLRVLALLGTMSEADRPRIFWPQARWMAVKVDILLPLHSFADFANRQTNEVTRRRGLKAITRGYEWQPKPPVSKDTRTAVFSFYAEDVAAFENLPVFPSDGQGIYTINGRCKACERLRSEAIAAAAEKAAAPPAPQPEAALPQEGAASVPADGQSGETGSD